MNAARIARTFRIDPVAVLDCDTFEWALRTAAHNIVARDAERASRSKGG